MGVEKLKGSMYPFGYIIFLQGSVDSASHSTSLFGHESFRRWHSSVLPLSPSVLYKKKIHRGPRTKVTFSAELRAMEISTESKTG